MVGYLVLIAAAVAAVALAAPANGPLHEIGRVAEPESICANAVVHVNAAIAAVLEADRGLRRTVASLRTIDLDEAAPGRPARLLELGRLAAEINDDTLRAGSETKRLRALEQKDGARAGQLRSFADALDAALAGQHKMAVDLALFLRYVDFRELQAAQSPPSQEHPNFGPPGDTGRGPVRALSPAPPTIYERPGRSEEGMARAAATDFEERTRDVASDEARAADHSEAAVTGC